MTSRYVVFRKPRGLTPELADRICELAEAQVGTRFDNGVLIAHALNDHFIGWLINKVTGDAARAASDALFNQKDDWICSELAAYVLNQIPQYAGKGNLAQRPGMLTPQELFENDEIFEPLPQPDGSLAFVTIDPVAAGFPFVRADKDGVRKLVVRDGQHEYVFDEVK
jgi:hypothetical protein